MKYFYLVILGLILAACTIDDSFIVTRELDCTSSGHSLYYEDKHGNWWGVGPENTIGLNTWTIRSRPRIYTAISYTLFYDEFGSYTEEDVKGSSRLDYVIINFGCTLTEGVAVEKAFISPDVLHFFDE